MHSSLVARLLLDFPERGVGARLECMLDSDSFLFA